MPSTPEAQARLSSIAAWPVLHPTAQAAYNQILWNHGLAKADVARRLGVSRARMTAVGRELELAGLVVPAGRETRATQGRPGDTLVATPDRFHFLGIHVRARQLVAAIIDLENRVVWEASATVVDLSSAVLFEHCGRWLSDANTEGFRVAAVAFCGSFQQLDDAPPGVGLRRVIGEGDRFRFSERMGGPVWVEDDMVALTAFEQWPRLGEGEDSMVLIALGPQIGFGIVTDRRIVVGAHRMAGRFAPVLVAPDGAPCPLGHRGCLWSVASVSSIVAQVPGATTLEEVVLLADTDASIGLVLGAAAWGLGAAVGHIANLIDPDRVVLAGDARRLLQGRDEEFRAGMSAVALGTEPVVDTTDFGFVEWARAAAGLSLYRTLGGDRT